LMDGSLWLPIFSVHFLVVGALALLCYFFGQQKEVGRFLYLNMIAVGFLGVFGAFITLIVLSIYLAFRSRTTSLMQLLDNFFPGEEEDLSEVLYERVRFGMDDFDPRKMPVVFQDVLEYGSESQKRLAIERMLKHFRPEFTKAFSKALNDSSNAIRVVAATAVTRIDKQYAETEERLKKDVENNSEDIAALLDYAKHCHEYSELDIIDRIRALKLRARAIEAYSRYREAKPGIFFVDIALASLFYSNGEYHRVLTLLSPYFQKSEPVDYRIYRWYMSSLFQLRRWRDLYQFANRDHTMTWKQSVEFDAMMDLIMLWRTGFHETVNIKRGMRAES